MRTALATGDMGFLHSFTTGSAVDGPGIRVVAWTAGCMWRCLYCHNPDTWTMSNGIPVTVARATEELGKYRHGLKVMTGGFTISGGEPLMQHRFVVKLLTAAHEHGHPHGARHQRLLRRPPERRRSRRRSTSCCSTSRAGIPSGTSASPAWRTGRRWSSRAASRDRKRPIWVRFVLVPGLTDDPDDIAADRALRRRARQRRARRRAALPPDGPLQVGAAGPHLRARRRRAAVDRGRRADAGDLPGRRPDGVLSASAADA